MLAAADAIVSDLMGSLTRVFLSGAQSDEDGGLMHPAIARAFAGIRSQWPLNG